MSLVKMVQVTPEPEKMMGYIARVSNPAGQTNDNFAKLLKYCIDHKHYSVFEHATLTLEINTSLAIATQILRHRSFTFQQFSQRYAQVGLLQDDLPLPDLRKQDLKNRQNSTDDLDPTDRAYLQAQIKEHFANTLALYEKLLGYGVAKECARFILPQATQTRLYMTGSCRSWIHYIDLRSSNGTQKEHMEVAEQAKTIFKEVFPTVSEAMGWACSPPKPGESPSV